MREPIKKNSTDKTCVLECYYCKESKTCGSCGRTLEEIAEAGRSKKDLNLKKVLKKSLDKEENL